MSAAASCLNIVNSAELARLNYLLNHLHISVKTGLEAYGNNFAAFLFCLADSDSLIKSNSHRFFKKHRKTVLKRVLKYAPLKSDFVRAVAQDETIKTKISEDMYSVSDDTVIETENFTVDETTGEVIESDGDAQ